MAQWVTSEQVVDAVLRGSWVVDLRHRTAYAQAHVAGSVNVEHDGDFVEHLGWLVPLDDDIVLVTDSPAVLEAAARDLTGLGADVEQHLLDQHDLLRASYRRASWSSWAGEVGADPTSPRVLVDVRPPDQHTAGQVDGAVPLALTDAEATAPLLPPGELWVHCATGVRAGVAASLLHRMGRSVVHVDDTWEHALELGLTGQRIAA